MGALITERGQEFEYYVRALRGQFGGNLDQLIFETNKEIFWMRKNPTDWFKPIPTKRIQTGMFYIINYEFNGNKLYCPIFSIDYRVSDNNKHNLYAINLDYLPFDYKVIYFQEIYNKGKQIFEANANASDVLSEKKIPVNFEGVYNSLKSNGGFHYCISAFDLNKINEVFVVSTNLMYLMIHVHMRPLNIELMKQLMNQYDKGSEINEKLEKLINELEQMTINFDTDVIEYYKKLRNLENNYKLFDN